MHNNLAVRAHVVLAEVGPFFQHSGTVLIVAHHAPAACFLQGEGEQQIAKKGKKLVFEIALKNYSKNAKKGTNLQ